MSGHSKWSTIKRKKEATDGARAKIFTKIGREIAIAVREGGPDPISNFKLATVIAKAKASNVPNDNIERSIKKAAGSGERDEFEVIMYEGYGAGGVAFMVQALTDNRNRTAGDLRHFFDKYGGNLGQSGCVSFMFEQKGVIIIESDGVDEAALMEDCIEAGADDFGHMDGYFEIKTAPADFMHAVTVLASKGYELASRELEYIPSTYTAVSDDEVRQKLEKFLDVLDDCDDVSEVWHNME